MWSKGASVGSFRINRLLFADELVARYCLHLLTGPLLCTLDRFYATCERAGMKISTKKTGVLCHCRNPRHAVYTTSKRKYTAAGREVQLGLPWGGIHEWRKIEQRDSYREWWKMQFCVTSLLCAQKIRVFKHLKAFRFNSSLLRSSPMVMNLG